MLTKSEAIDKLARADHAFLSEEGSNEIAEPFGFKPHVYVAPTNVWAWFPAAGLYRSVARESRVSVETGL